MFELYRRFTLFDWCVVIGMALLLRPTVGRVGAWCLTLPRIAWRRSPLGVVLLLLGVALLFPVGAPWRRESVTVELAMLAFARSAGSWPESARFESVATLATALGVLLQVVGLRRDAARERHDRAIASAERAEGTRRHREVLETQARETIRQAWDTIAKSAGKSGDLGRTAALELLHVSGKTFERADLRLAELKGAVLPGARMLGADLSESNLADADLEGAYLRHSMLDKANFQGAKLYRAKLASSSMNEACFIGTKLNGAELSHSDLRGARFDSAGTDASFVSFQASDLENARFEKCDLRGASFYRANLRGASFTAARNLTAEQLAGAINVEHACLPEGLVVATTSVEEFKRLCGVGPSSCQTLPDFPHWPPPDPPITSAPSI